MFFVFGPSGQMYRGGVENLSRVAPVRRVPRTQALRNWETEVQGLPSDNTVATVGAAALQSEAQRTADNFSTGEPLVAALNLRVLDAVSAYVSHPGRLHR